MEHSWYQMGLVAHEQRKDRMDRAQELRQVQRPRHILGISPVAAYSRLLSKLGEALEDCGCWLQTRSATLVPRS